jgi:hypothetical protein
MSVHRQPDRDGRACLCFRRAGPLASPSLQARTGDAGNGVPMNHSTGVLLKRRHRGDHALRIDHAARYISTSWLHMFFPFAYSCDAWHGWTRKNRQAKSYGPTEEPLRECLQHPSRVIDTPLAPRYMPLIAVAYNAPKY